MSDDTEYMGYLLFRKEKRQGIIQFAKRYKKRQDNLLVGDDNPVFGG